MGGHKIIPKVYPVPSHILIFQLFKHRLNGNTSKGNNVKSRGSFKDPAQAEGKYLFKSISLIWPNLIQVTLKKRGWGRLAELGETYYENLVEDDNVGKLLVQNVYKYDCSERFQSNRWSTTNIFGNFSQARRSSGRTSFRWQARQLLLLKHLPRHLSLITRE